MTAEDQFIRNKYYRWYQRLCSGWSCAKDRTEDYIEKHHILPKAMGGNNNKGNIVKLSFRKHFLAHWLLTRCTQGSARTKMLTALHGMKRKGKFRVVSGWQFAVARVALVQWHADPVVKTAICECLKKTRANPAFKAAQRDGVKKWNADPAVKAANSERRKKASADPVVKAAFIERIKRMNADPIFQAAHSERGREAMRKLQSDPVFKSATIERMKSLHTDPAFKAATRERVGETMRKLHSDPVFRAAHSERSRKRMQAMNATRYGHV